MIDYTEAKALLDELTPEYADRHDAHTKLRDFYHGRYWNQADSSVHGLASIFKDVTSVKSDVGPDMKLVRNLIFDVCVKYQSFLSNLPMIRTFADRPDSRRSRAQAALKERALYGSWDYANMGGQLNRMGWYGPLMGDSFLGIWPDLTNYCVKAVVRSPEFAYPVPNIDGDGTNAILFKWDTTVNKAKRSYSGWDTPAVTTSVFGKSRLVTGTDRVEVLEYSDSNQFVRWVDGKQTNGVEHNLGFNLFDQVPFIQIPGEPWNHGAVEQYVGLVEAGNELYSLMMQAMIENVFPRMLLIDPMKFGETIDTGPGAVVAVNQGGDMKFVAPGGEALAVASALMQENERAVKQGTSMPDVNFGQDSHSVITGKAVNALQGAGTGSLVDMIQGCGHGPALTNWNAKALTIYQRMFPDDQIYLQGMRPSSLLDLNPRQFALSFKGKEIIGSPRNEVVFGPYIDQHGKLVMALQAQGAGLTSKEWGREQIGISDSEAMQEEIIGEAIEEAVVGALIAALQADPSAEKGDETQANANSYLSGGPVRAPLSAVPQQPPGGPGGGLPVQQLPGGGAVSAPALPLPDGSSLSQVGAPSQAAPTAGAAAPPAPAAPVTLQTAQRAFSQVDLQGKAWLVGQIAAQGKASTVEVAVTDPADRDPLQHAASFPVVFHVVPSQPKERSVAIQAAVAA